MNSLPRILVVDDMPAMRSIVKNMLAEAGFNEVLEVEDGEAAWKVIQESARIPEHAFSLVIADWNMPGMSGAELLRAIRSFSPTRMLPFFIVTAERNHDYFTEAVHCGVTDYVVKPFTSAQLAEKIQKVLEKSPDN